MSATIDSYGVEAATDDDREALLAFATMIIGEDSLQEVSDSKVTGLVDRCIARDRSIAGIIASKAGIEASIGLIVDQFDYSDDDHLRVVWIGVHPAFRRTNHGARLMQFAQCFQEGVGIPLFLDLLTRTQLEGKLHLFSRLAPQVGASFSFGAVPADAFSQGHVALDPLQARKRHRKDEAHAAYLRNHPQAKARPAA